MNSEKPLLQAADEAEPTAGTAATPVFLFVLLLLLTYWGMYYLDQHSGGFQALAYEPYSGLDELRALEPKPTSGFDPRYGKAVYERTCGVCHQPTGLGAAGQFPPLASSEWVNEPDPARLIRIALDGAQGPITVNGQEWNLIMSVNGKQLGLSDQDLAAVLSYVRQAWGNKAPPVTAEQVKAIRPQTEGRSVQWTATELLAVPVKK
ncbi:MAG: cytochrome c [Verrucomicrobia bacterium]|nr:cytochrome c [Verrucomicrobiota bacterium]